MIKILAIVFIFSFCPTVFAQTASEYYEKALLAFNDDKIQESYIFLKNALQQNPDHLPAKLLMGRVLLIDGYVKDAIDEFQEALQGGTDKNLVLVPLSRAYLMASQFQKCIKLLEERNLRPDVKTDLIVTASEAYFRSGLYDEAILLLKEGISGQPTSVPLYSALISLYMSRNSIEEAENLLNKVQVLAPQAIDILHLDGQLLEAKGNIKEAVSRYREVNQAQPGNPAYMRSLASALAEIKEFEEANLLVKEIDEKTPGDVQNQLLKARILALTEQQMEAQIVLKKVSEDFSLLSSEKRAESLHLSLVAGVVAYIGQDYDNAATELAHYTNSTPPSVEILGMLVDSLLRVGNYKEAIVYIDNYTEIVLQNIDVAVLACELYISTNRIFKCDNMIPKLQVLYPQNTEIMLLNTKLLMARKKYQEAANYLNNNIKDNNRTDVLELKLSLFASQQDFVSSLSFAKSLIESDPNNIDYQALYADIAVRLNNIEEAESVIDGILQFHPNNLGALVTKARIEFAKNHQDSALEIINRILRDNKRNIIALQLAAQIHANKGKFDEALEMLTTAKLLDNKAERPRLLLVETYAKQNNYEAALTEINQLLNVNRLSADYMLIKADILTRLKRLEEAGKVLGAVYGLWSEQPVRLLQLSERQIQSRDFVGAERSLKKAINLAPDAEPPQLELIKLLLNIRKIDEADKALKTLTSKFGKSANSELLAGDLDNVKNNNAQAFSHYIRASQLASEYQLPVVKMYEMVREGYETEPFISYVENLLLQKPENTFYRHLLADTYFTAKQLQKAEKHYQQLVDVDNLPRKAYIYNNLANIYKDVDQDKALEFSNKALKLAPNNADILDTKGWLLTKTSQYQEGLSLLRQAYTISSSKPAIHYHIAYNLYAQGKKNEALRILENNRTVTFDFTEKNEAKALLEKLRQ